MVPPNPLFDNVQFNQALFGGLGAGLTGQTVGGLIYAALRKAAVTLGPGRTPSPAQTQDAIDELRRLTGSLNCDRLFIFTNSKYVFPLSGKAAYTIGQDPTGTVTPDFDGPRPQLIEAANILSSDSPPYPYPLRLVDTLGWNRIGYRDLKTPTIPEVLYNDRAYPISTLYLDAAPMAGYQLELFSWYQVPTYTSAGDVVLLPLQYEDALVLNLACRLAPHFQKVLDQNVREDARISLMRLESINAPQPIADLSGGVCGCNRYNVYSDQTK
jgi:hypothetical protein